GEQAENHGHRTKLEYGSTLAANDAGVCSFDLTASIAPVVVSELQTLQFDGDCCHDRLCMMLGVALLGFLEIEGAVDKRDVRESLRIVTQRHVFLGVDFLGK